MKLKLLRCPFAIIFRMAYLCINGDPQVSADEEWMVFNHVVVPKHYQIHVMNLAHDNPMAGHLGVSKTCDCVMQNFYWHNLRQSVTDYCRTCHIYQLVGKPNQDPPKAPLKPIPTMEELFSKIIVDCVGPLPKSRSGHQYVLTIICVLPPDMLRLFLYDQ